MDTPTSFDIILVSSYGHLQGLRQAASLEVDEKS